MLEPYNLIAVLETSPAEAQARLRVVSVQLSVCSRGSCLASETDEDTVSVAALSYPPSQILHSRFCSHGAQDSRIASPATRLSANMLPTSNRNTLLFPHMHRLGAHAHLVSTPTRPSFSYVASCTSFSHFGIRVSLCWYVLFLSFSGHAKYMSGESSAP